MFMLKDVDEGSSRYVANVVRLQPPNQYPNRAEEIHELLGLRKTCHLDLRFDPRVAVMMLELVKDMILSMLDLSFHPLRCACSLLDNQPCE